MTNIVKTFNNNTPVLVNGKAVLYCVKLDGKTNRMDVAKRIFAEYNNCFSNIADVISTIRAYEKKMILFGLIKSHTLHIKHNTNPTERWSILKILELVFNNDIAK